MNCRRGVPKSLGTLSEWDPKVCKSLGALSEGVLKVCKSLGARPWVNMALYTGHTVDLDTVRLQPFSKLTIIYNYLVALVDVGLTYFYKPRSLD